MVMLHLTSLVALCAPLFAAALRVDDAQWAASNKEAELSDQRFWVAQWRTLEKELLMLSSPDGFLQIGVSAANSSKTPAPKVESKKPEPAKVEKAKDKPKAPAHDLKAKNAIAVAAKDVKVHTVAAHTEVEHEQMEKRLADVKSMTKGLAGKAMLAPMLSMLKGLYQDQKARIGDLNKKEEESKKKYLERKAYYDKKLQKVKDGVEHHKMSVKFGANETRDFTKYEKYWEGVRDRAHKQFHNSLKITHGLMAKEKDAIKKYEEALATKDPVLAKAEGLAASLKSSHAANETQRTAEVPDVVLAQQRRALVGYCHEALVEVRRELQETRRPIVI